MNRYAFAFAVTTALAACVPPGTQPGSTGQGTSDGSAQLSRQCADASFGVSSAARRVTTFLGATARFASASASLDASLRQTCEKMGRELGLRLSGDTSTTCDAVSRTLREEMDALRTESSLEIAVNAVPPHCEVSMDAYASCAAECDVDVEPGKIDLECRGGYVAGRCSAECTGQCDVGASAVCEGTCEGTCEGGCTGVCKGQCDGTCSATNADGECDGRCEGTCYGTCSAGCQGSCQGSCWAEAHAHCQGSCRGGCSVELERPYCTGEVEPPRVSAECQAGCDARLHAEAECTPGKVDVAITGGSAIDSPRADRVRRAVQAGYGELAAIRASLSYMRRAGRDLVGATADLRGTGRELGMGAVACITEAATVVAGATASVSVSIEVSASVSASAGM
jgi:hypothetical protein